MTARIKFPRYYNGKLYLLTTDAATAFDAFKAGKTSHNQLKDSVDTGRPDSYTRALREKGLPVRSEWRTNFEGRRYKVYYLPPEEATQNA